VQDIFEFAGEQVPFVLTVGIYLEFSGYRLRDDT
jgi:hypothetical protein